MPPRARRLGGLVVLAVFVILSMSAVSSVSAIDLTPADLFDDGRAEPDGVEDAEAVRLVSVGPEQDRLWPFTSRGKSFDTLTLPINVVVEGDSARVRSLLVYSQDARWDETNESWKEVPGERNLSSADGSVWGPATGADRYTYVDTDAPGALWVDESTQLHDGTYFGSRIHLRLYGVGSQGNSWTAIQAHRDYWDWFRLRHTVTGLAGPQHTVERDLMDQPAVTEVRRVRYGNGGIFDADGWVTVVELAPPQLVSEESVDDQPVSDDTASSTNNDVDDAEPEPTSSTIELTDSLVVLSLVALAIAGVGGLATFARDGDRTGALTERFHRSRLGDPRVQRAIALFATLVLLPLFIRWVALVLEGFAPNHPKIIAGLLYPVFALGPPAVALWLPRGYSSERWFGLAFLGYGIGLVVDFGFVGVSVVPLDLVLHRFVVLVSLGLLAVVGHRRSGFDDANSLALPATIGLWILLLLWPLFLGV
ncbi:MULTISPECIES: hypothetical protein [Haloferax]|uniref:Uncharacterized protein n=2 Tax=Haloferax TaxID=2251 RepID=A0A6G1Z7D5_9EURY|nr:MULTISPECIES: hypothetical protein [Haloferax]KAB1185151.1 hypothetical protein Hfx1149_16670 [Haloferax sp. CBA1149]MRW82328.1 hypothetical protein [Haloferax marinisediminis]